MSLFRNVSYNLGGAVVTTAVGLLTVPLFLRAIGPERFGVLSIAWLLLGYFVLFDMGLTRATAYRMASLRGEPAQKGSDVFWTSLVVNAPISVVGAIALWGAAKVYFLHYLNISPPLKAEASGCAPLLALVLPISIMASVLTGILNGKERFFATNLSMVSSSVLFQILPLFTAYFIGKDLDLLIASALIGRATAIPILLAASYRAVVKGHRARVRLAEARLLFGYGGWVTVGALVGSLISSIDRLGLGSIVDAIAITIYAIPLQVAQRLAMIPTALMGALFPRLPGKSHESQRELCRMATATLLAVMTPLVVLGICAMHPFMYVWVGGALGPRSAEVGVILLMSAWWNALAVVPYGQLQATGRPSVVTRTHLAEAVVYSGLSLGLIYLFGVFGAASALLLRNLADFALLTRLAGIDYPSTKPLMALVAIQLLAAIGSAMVPYHIGIACILMAISIPSSLLMAWVVAPAELRARLKSLAWRPSIGLLRRL